MGRPHSLIFHSSFNIPHSSLKELPFRAHSLLVLIGIVVTAASTVIASGVATRVTSGVRTSITRGSTIAGCIRAFSYSLAVCLLEGYVLQQGLRIDILLDYLAVLLR